MWTLKLKYNIFVIAPKKFFGVNLTIQVQDLYDENYTVLMKEIKDLNIWRSIPCS